MELTMTAPLSRDLRERIVRSVSGGTSIREAAKRFEVSPSAAIKLMQRVRETGSTAPARVSAAIVACCSILIAGFSTPTLQGVPSARSSALATASAEPSPVSATDTKARCFGDHNVVAFAPGAPPLCPYTRRSVPGGAYAMTPSP